MFNCFLVVPLLLGSMMAGIPQIVSVANPLPSINAQATPAKPIKQSPIAPITLQIKGAAQSVPLSFVQTSYFSTSLPIDRFALNGWFCDQGGCNVISFSWKQPDGTPNKLANFGIYYEGTKSISQVREMLVEKGGYFETQRWRQIKQRASDAYAKTAYPWLRELIRFEADDSRSTVGTAYIGEENGQAFYAIAFYPRQYEAEFAPRADVVLKNLKLEKQN